MAFGNVEPLILICNFILDFLCIHPFNDGNGRMSRLLTILLLYQSGFIVGKYVSIEKAIADNKELYYEVLQKSDENWHEETNDPTHFIVYALEDLAEEMHKGISTIKNNMNELVMAGLIEKRRCNTGRANMIFVKVPMTSLNSQKTDCLGPENEPYNSQKTDCYRARKLAANNNNNKQYKYTDYKNVEGETL